MEFISLAGKKIEGAYVNGDILTVRVEDGRCLIAQIVKSDGKAILEVILNK